MADVLDIAAGELAVGGFVALGEERRFSFSEADREPPPPRMRSMLVGEVAVAALAMRRPEGDSLRNQFANPVWQRKSGGVDFRIVIVAFQLDALIGGFGLADAGGGAEWLAALAGP